MTTEVRINTTTREPVTNNPQPVSGARPGNLQQAIEQMGSAGYDVGSDSFTDGRTREAQATFSTVPGIIGTAKTPGGFPTMNVRDNSIVKLPNGMQTSAKVAAGLGFLKSNGDGTYSDIITPTAAAPTAPRPAGPQEASPQSSPQTSQQQQELNTIPMDPQTQGFLNEMSTLLGGDEALNKFANAVIAGMESSEMGGNNHLTGKFLSRYAEDHGMKLETAQAAAHAIIDGYTAHATAYLNAKTGGRGQEILEWAKEKFDLASHQEVMRLHWNKSMAGYDAILKEWNKAQLSKARGAQTSSR